jgi:glycosyltransferase involved in cell wall biosynthesis
MSHATPSGPKRSPGVVRVAVDLTTFSGGGGPGGLKLFVFGFLQWMAEARGSEFAFTYFTRLSLVPEVETFRRAEDWNICLGLDPGTLDPGQRRPGMVWAPGAASNWTEHWPADVLYTPWGYSEFSRPEVPSVNLVADTLHRDWPDLLPADEVARREAWFRRMLSKAAAVQCNSDFVKAQLVRHFGAPAELLFVTHNAIQHQLVSAPGRKSTGPASRPYFLYPANDWPHKNHERLFEAYASYRKEAGAGAWDLVLTGHFARGGALQDRISSHGIAENCRVLGYLDRAEFAPIFRGAGALFFPSLYEGFGIPVLEAMALGLPVACGNIASLPEVAGDCALYFDPTRTDAIARALARISGDSPLRRKLSAAGPVRAGTFSIEREAGRLADRIISVARS